MLYALPILLNQVSEGDQLIGKCPAMKCDECPVFSKTWGALWLTANASKSLWKSFERESLLNIGFKDSFVVV